jgi:hypothetical protein
VKVGLRLKKLSEKEALANRGGEEKVWVLRERVEREVSGRI